MQFSNGHYMNLFLSTYFVLKNKFLSFSSKKKKKKKLNQLKKLRQKKKHVNYNNQSYNYIINESYQWVFLWHWLTIYFRKVLTSFLWKMEKAIKTLIVFFSFPIKTFFKQIINHYPKGKLLDTPALP